MSKLRPVVVEWLDATGMHGWFDPAQTDPCPIRIMSVGYLVERTKKQLVMISSYTEQGMYGDYLVIPAPWIVRVKRLKT